MSQNPLKNTPLLLEYVSGHPGLGKTQASIDYMVQHLTNPEKSSILIYTPPLVCIIEEVYEQLLNRFPSTKKARALASSYLVPLYGKPSSPEKKNYSLCPPGQVMQSIYIVLGRDKPDTSKSTLLRKMPLGSILFITHKSFRSIEPLAAFEHIEVIFDEAEKFIDPISKVRFPSKKIKKTFLGLFDLKPAISADSPRAKKRSPGYQEASVPDSLTKAALHDTLEEMQQEYRIFGNHRQESNKKHKDKPIPQTQINDLIRSLFNPRQQTFFDTSEQSLDVFKVTLPTHCFIGFKRAIVMASHFEDTQMYHLLVNQPNVRLRDITATFIPNYQEKLEKIEARQANTYIFPLIKDKGVLSKTHFHNPLVPQELAEETREFLHKYEIQGSDVFFHRTLALPPGEDEEEHKTLKPNHQLVAESYALENRGVIFHTLEWYVAQAALVILKARQKLKLWEFPQKPNSNIPLLTFNDGFYKELKAKDKALSLPFEHVDHFAKGVNKYQDSNAIAFLASINPPRELKSFFKDLLPTYDYHSDHVGDTLVQCICRTSIRDKEATNPIIVVVANQQAAEILKNKLGGRPKIIKKFMQNLKPAFSTFELENEAHHKRLKEYQKQWRDNNKKRKALLDKKLRLKKNISLLEEKQYNTRCLSAKERNKLWRYKQEFTQVVGQLGEDKRRR